ncbi:hypothetical protein Ahy_B10g104817 isoform B [Arachis hypogaea]|uniref:SWIM-type domain-containing protein n=1 Tax=Arachis hypogaea TaxID=3818 RepID=A0A444X6H7_ARAHY|nr:hypothetical protein Ahy_B10g104817 isoform B [Arachis hypogaea]
MESVASNSDNNNSSSSSSSSSSQQNHHHHHPRFKPSQPISDRIVRALRHRLLLLHRSTTTFFVFGATGNVYTVNLSSTPSCTCPDRTTPCKHILFVLIRVLGVPLDDACLRRRTLRPCQVQRLMAAPTLPEAVAGDALKCMEEMGKEEKLVACGTCRNPIHEECLMRWKRSSGRRSASCVICRARWRNRAEQDKYVNLSAYVSEDDDVMPPPSSSLCTDHP